MTKELAEINEALVNWFQSQDITPLTAMHAMCIQVGLLLALQASSKQHLDKGVDIVGETIEVYANQAWRKK